MKELGKYIIELKNGTKKMFKEFFRKETNKKQRANMWTFSRLLVTPIIPIFMILKLPIIATITVLFGAVTDFFDGRSARKHGSTSEYGRLLDLVVDKIFSSVLGISLAIFNPLFLVNLIGEGIISVTNVIYQLKNNNIKVESSKVGKIKQWPLALTFLLGYISSIFPAITTIASSSIIITSVFQVVTLSEYIKENNKKIKEAKILDQVSNSVLETTESNQKEEVYSRIKELNDRKQQYLNLKEALNKIIKKKEEEQKIVTYEDNNKKIIRKIKK